MRCGVLILFKELNIGTVQITDLSKHTVHQNLGKKKTVIKDKKYCCVENEINFGFEFFRKRKC